VDGGAEQESVSSENEQKAAAQPDVAGGILSEDQGKLSGEEQDEAVPVNDLHLDEGQEQLGQDAAASNEDQQQETKTTVAGNNSPPASLDGGGAAPPAATSSSSPSPTPNAVAGMDQNQMMQMMMMAMMNPAVMSSMMGGQPQPGAAVVGAAGAAMGAASALPGGAGTMAAGAGGAAAAQPQVVPAQQHQQQAQQNNFAALQSYHQIGGMPVNSTSLPVYQGPKTLENVPPSAALHAIQEAVKNDKRYMARLKSFNCEKGFGFVAGEELHQMFGRDVFVHKTEMEKLTALYAHVIPVNSLLCFSVVLNKAGQPQVRELLLVVDEEKDREAPLLQHVGHGMACPAQSQAILKRHEQQQAMGMGMMGGMMPGMMGMGGPMGGMGGPMGGMGMGGNPMMGGMGMGMPGMMSNPMMGGGMPGMGGAPGMMNVNPNYMGGPGVGAAGGGAAAAAPTTTGSLATGGAQVGDIFIRPAGDTTRSRSRSPRR